MTANVKNTDFAPAERAPESRIDHEAGILQSQPLLEQLLDSIPDIVLILNTHRQIAFANQATLDIFNITDRRDVNGLRPGELMRCIHSDILEGGCGTTLFCKNCGAVDVILSGLHGKKRIDECRITQKDTGKAFDLRVSATPVTIDDLPFILFYITDISHEKRRHILERTFFHDISNTLFGIIGYTSILATESSAENQDIREYLRKSVNQLSDEIQYQKALISAENGDLAVSPVNIGSADFLDEIVNTHRTDLDATKVPRIIIDDQSADTKFISDKVILARVLSNMLKNAVEASRANDTVTVGCTSDGETISFRVHNPQYIPTDIQMQIFNRSFSTKGKGRGIGTYSMKLLTEHYLQGRISFTSTPDHGTVFTAELPLKLE